MWISKKIRLLDLGDIGPAASTCFNIGHTCAFALSAIWSAL